MLKHLPQEGLDSLFALYNKIWLQWYFPEECSEFTIVKISKPRKYPMKPAKLSSVYSNMCSLQSIGGDCKSKTVWFFHQKGTLSTLQYGVRAKQSTIDHLLSLEATKRKAQASNEQVVSIFFEKEKNLQFDMETQHPDWPKRARIRMKNVELYTKRLSSSDPLKSKSTIFYLIQKLKEKIHPKEAQLVFHFLYWK